ncbi:DsbA family protein [soil metagenome]
MRATLRTLLVGLAATLLIGTAVLAQTSPPDARQTSPAEPPKADLDITDLMKPTALGDKAMGNANAPVTMIEYASLTCPHCAAFANDVFPAVKAKYIDTGKIRYILREFPLDQLALAAVMGARCAPADAFFPLVEMLFREQKDWAFIDNPGPALVERLTKHGLGEDAFMKCLEDKDLQEKIIAIEDEANSKFGVDGTPAFFFNGQMHGGEMTIEEIDEMVAPMLPKT